MTFKPVSGGFDSPSSFRFGTPPSSCSPSTSAGSLGDTPLGRSPRFSSLSLSIDVDSPKNDPTSGSPINEYKRKSVPNVSMAEGEGLIARVTNAAKMGGITPLRRGTYLIGDSETDKIAVFKPQHEVRGGRDSVGFTERMMSRQLGGEEFKSGDAIELGIGKYGIDPEAEIPNEVITKLLHPYLYQSVEPICLNEKEGVFISFIEEAIDFAALSPHERSEFLNRLNLNDLQKMAILDLSLHNTDRHGGNLLCSTRRMGEIYPFDHALILPRKFASSATFCWMDWLKTRERFSPESLQIIDNLDFNADAKTISENYPTYPKDNLDVMEICYYLLKQGARKGLSPFEIGAFLINSSEFTQAPIKHIYEAADGNKDKIHIFIDTAVTMVARSSYLTEHGPMQNKDLKELIEEGIRECVFENS